MIDSERVNVNGNVRIDQKYYSSNNNNNKSFMHPQKAQLATAEMNGSETK